MGWGSALLIWQLTNLANPPALPGQSTVAQREERAKPSRRGEQWRAQFLISTSAFVSGINEPDDGLTLGLHLGVGMPVESTVFTREEHGFGYEAEVSVRAFAEDGRHRHRLSAAGLVGRDEALFYQVTMGAAIYGFHPLYREYGPSVGGKIGIAMGKRFNYILSVGGDVDTLMSGRGLTGVVPMLSVSLLTVGML